MGVERERGVGEDHKCRRLGRQKWLPILMPSRYANGEFRSIGNPIMSITLQADPLPLRLDEQGTIRIGNTRVLLELVVYAHQGGATVEEIAKRFETLEMADVHTVIAYILRHRKEVEEYMTRREAEAAELQKQIQEAMPPRVTRKELQARWDARKGL